ncbi:MAG: hypothetical protein AB1591_12985 [Pseudomonadota bacterium]
MLQLVFPAFARTDEILDLSGEARLPGVDLLIARARREAIAQSDLESLLCEELGIARQHDWPVAAIALAQSGGRPGNDCWLRADPVHMRIERDRVILNEIAEPGPEEARFLCESLGAHFGEAFSPQPLRPGAWVVRMTDELEISTTPPSLAAGRHIDQHLPTGRDAMHWRRLLNEIQMLLFDHPVNRAREARGEPVINSVWLWGGGRLPEVRSSARSVLCGHPDWLALAGHAGASVGPLPPMWSQDVSDNALVILDAPHRHLRRGDFDSWLTAMRDFEHSWLQPLLGSGRPFELRDPLQGMRLVWRSAYRWKFWRRPQKPMQRGYEIQDASYKSGAARLQERIPNPES